jgi:hypothetical protein
MAFTKEHAAQLKALREWGRKQGRKHLIEPPTKPTRAGTATKPEAKS